jgi:plasmid stabilization system protein ParE
MKIVLTDIAHAQLDHQFLSGVERFGFATAQKTFKRVDRFFATTLTDYPRTGTYLPSHNQYEWPIPGTPFVILYRIEDTNQIVRVLGFIYYSQSRAGFDPDTGDLT